MAKIAYTASTLAAEVETAPKTLRKFLRTAESGIAPVGKGGRYSIEMTATQLAKFKKNFAAWSAQAEADRAARAEELAAKKLNVLTIAPASEGVDEVDEDPTDDEDLDATELTEELDFGGMTDEDIEAALDEIATEGDEFDDPTGGMTLEG